MDFKKVIPGDERFHARAQPALLDKKSVPAREQHVKDCLRSVHVTFTREELRLGLCNRV